VQQFFFDRMKLTVYTASKRAKWAFIPFKGSKIWGNHHFLSFCFKNHFLAITSRVFPSKIFFGASHQEFLSQKSLMGHHIESFSFKKLWRSITSRFFCPKIFFGASHQEFLLQKSLVEHHIESFCVLCLAAQYSSHRHIVVPCASLA